MAVETWSPTTMSWVTGFAASDLNSLANGSAKTSTGTAIDNTGTGSKTRIVLRFLAGSSLTAAANGHILVFLLPSYDGTNYVSHTDGATTSSHAPWYQYPTIAIGLRNTAAQENQMGGPVQLLPLKYKLVAINRTGVTLPASGNAIDYALFSPAIV